MNERSLVVGFLAGGAVGAALVLLMAPQPGEATRKRIGRRVREGVESARELSERLMRTGEHISEEASRRVKEAGSVLAGHGLPGPAGNRGEGAL